MTPSLPIADSICLLTRTHPSDVSTCTNRTLRIGGWLTDLIAGVKALGIQGQTITLIF